MTSKDYRPDIDGLRAFAVLCVVFFHAGFTAFSGGFIGVDVFFVISGFLITRLIRGEAGKGAFSYAHFYLRRARRLLPALFFVYILCYIFAYLLFIPEHFERFGKSLLASVFSVSNIYFWSEADYFDTEAIFKPLLHTWSLSIEEQFYMFWPVSFLFLLKQRKAWLAPLMIVIAGIVSLVLNPIFAEHRAAIFYLIPFRIFEFCIGALTVWIAAMRPRKEIILEPLLLLGLGMILYPAMGYTKDMVFPSFNALLPCIGTAVVIYSGQAKWCGALLRNRLMVFIGLISYSLYLTHWPVIVFYKYYRFEAISLWETWSVLFLSFLLSAIMYYFIESPWRKGRLMARFSPRQFAACSLATALVIAYGGYHVEAKNGLPKRASFKPISAAFEQAMQYKSCVGGYGICDPDNEQPEGHPDFVMIGDSHTNTMVYLFGAMAASHAKTIEKHTVTGCLSVYDNGLACAGGINATFDSAIERKIKNVLLVSNWNPLGQSYAADLLLEKIKHTILKLKAAGMNVYVYGSMPLMQRDPATCFERPLFSSCEEWMVPPDYDRQVAFNRQLKAVVVNSGAKYFDVFAVLCHDGRCRAGYEGRSLYGDKYHLKKINIGAYIFMNYADPKTLDFDSLFKGSGTGHGF